MTSMGVLKRPVWKELAFNSLPPYELCPKYLLERNSMDPSLSDLPPTKNGY